MKINATTNDIVFTKNIGGSDYDTANSIDVDSIGNIYIAGRTESSNFPTTDGAFDQTYSGGGHPFSGDCFITKLSSSGEILYSTLYGGIDKEEVYGIGVDSSGRVVVAGWTSSSDFPTAGPVESSYNSNGIVAGDAYSLMLNSDGSDLVYSRLFNGSDCDIAFDIYTTDNGDAYIGGKTWSEDFPVLNAYDDDLTLYNEHLAFLLHINSTGHLIYSTYIGGLLNENVIRGVVADQNGNAYAVGQTACSDFPIVNGYNSTHGGDYDCFVMKLSPSGEELLSSTFIGGSDRDYGFSIALDDDEENVYICGYTQSTNFPLVDEIYSENMGDYDCFVAQLPTSLDDLEFSTLIGGGLEDLASGIALDQNGYCVVAGTTQSDDFPTKDSDDSTLGGTHDGFVFRFGHESTTSTTTETTTTTTTSTTTTTTTNTTTNTDTDILAPEMLVLVGIIASGAILVVVLIVFRRR